MAGRRDFPSHPAQQATLDAATARISLSTIGFMRLSVQDGHEDAVPIGTGTLVSIGDLRGVVTAAHVLRALPDRGQVGLVRFADKEKQFQRMHFEMEYAVPIAVGPPAAEADAPNGPDIAFLMLPPDTAGALASSNVFLNLEKRRDEILAKRSSRRPGFDAVMGIIAERTKSLEPTQPRTLLKGVEGMLGTGVILSERTENGHDLYDFEVTFADGTKGPKSFGGTSGGGLWRIVLNESLTEIVETLPIGVAFYELFDRPIITCHGARTLYLDLLDRVRSWASGQAV